MAVSDRVRTVVEIGFGLVYLVGAIFNSLYTLGHGDDFYGSFARGAWFAPARMFVQQIVIPHSRPFTFLLIGFQLLVASAILSRGSYVALGLFAGGVFSVGAALASNVPGAVANLVLAAGQLLLGYAR